MNDMRAVDLFTHEDRLAGLDGDDALLTKIRLIHRTLQSMYSFIVRVAVATYDSDTDELHTFVASDDANPLVRYTSRLSNAPSLRDILREGRPRVVNDLGIFEAGAHEHTSKIASSGFAASYTVPVRQGDRFRGFIFFNSREPGVFVEAVLDELDVWGHLIASITAHEMATMRTLLGALRTASDMVHVKDPETFGHLQRMAQYARLIAIGLAETGRYPELTDEMIERIFWFAPMHDIGKLAMPDDIVKKPAPLTEDELEVMRGHSEMGQEILERLIQNFHLEKIHGIEILKQVASMHHETLDGSGYPLGLMGDEIPLVARIIAVADIFDALSNWRPYRKAWSIDEALETIQQLSGEKLDEACVEVLVDRLDEVRRIHKAFNEDA
jgi:HD-GYP domain-containing protein (c-di-GMP phosphodiesterase class II)